MRPGGDLGPVLGIQKGFFEEARHLRNRTETCAAVKEEKSCLKWPGAVITR